MRLKQIKIINFGQLSDLTFDLPSDNLNVFFGQNESGKSTTVAFVKQVMFGFYLRNNASPFFEDYKPLAHVSPMGGSLIFEDEDGSQFKLERLWAKGDKTKKGILTVIKDGQQVPESLFFDRIQNIDGNFYTDSFIFNQDMLGQIAKLSQADLLERIYYLGAANSGQLLDLREDFTKEAGKLFKKTAKKPEVNQLLTQLEDKRQELTETQKQFESYEALNSEVTSEEQKLNDEQTQLKKLQEQSQKLKKIQENLTNFDQLKKLQLEQKKVDFDSENFQKATELTSQKKNLLQNITSLQSRLSSDNEQNFNFEEAKKLIRQRPELLQWESQYRACLQKAKQLQFEEEQLLKLTPELGKILNLTETEIDELRSKYDSLPPKPEKVESASNNKNLLIIGLVVAALGLVLCAVSPLVGIICLLAGAGLAGYGFYQGKQAEEVYKAKIKENQAAENIRRAFEEQYQLNLDKTDLNNLISQYNDYQAKELALKANNTDLEEIKSQAGQLATNLEKFLKRPINHNFEGLKDELEQLDDQVEEKRHDQDEQIHLQTSLKETEQKVKEVDLELKAVLAKDGVDNLEDYDALYQESLRQAKLQTQIAALKESLGDSLDNLEKADPEKLVQELNQVQKEIQLEQDKIGEIRQQLAQRQVAQANLADSTAVFEAKQNLANTETSFIKASQEYLADMFAAKMIGRALDIASNERFPKMLADAKEYFKLLTNDRYIDLELDKKITVTRKDGKKREVKYLSRGTSEQLYFALKLAFVHQIKDQINLPILIDDSFVNFDDRRTTDIKELLNKIGEDNQVLIFTAQSALVDKLDRPVLTFKKGSTNA